MAIGLRHMRVRRFRPGGTSANQILALSRKSRTDHPKSELDERRPDQAIDHIDKHLSFRSKTTLGTAACHHLENNARSMHLVQVKREIRSKLSRQGEYPLMCASQSGSTRQPFRDCPRLVLAVDQLLRSYKTITVANNTGSAKIRVRRQGTTFRDR